jgi:hypothetical protein
VCFDAEVAVGLVWFGVDALQAENFGCAGSQDTGVYLPAFLPAGNLTPWACVKGACRDASKQQSLYFCFGWAVQRKRARFVGHRLTTECQHVVRLAPPYIKADTNSGKPIFLRLNVY